MGKEERERGKDGEGEEKAYSLVDLEVLAIIAFIIDISAKISTLCDSVYAT
jgi:hypothetical protein